MERGPQSLVKLYLGTLFLNFQTISDQLTMRIIVCMFILLFMAESAISQIYSMYVANESDDTVMLVEFDGLTFSIPDTITVGNIHTEIEGPHGLAVDLRGDHWFVSIAHGKPNGWVVRYSTAEQRPTGAVMLGLFPASMAISPHTGLLHVVNFNLHGNLEPSSISVVDPDAMLEVGRITTGIMPHGSAFQKDGKRHYSVAMMSHELFEMDALNLRISRKIPLGAGTRPTWVTHHPHEPLAYIAGNGSDEVIIVNTDSGAVSDRIAIPGAPYNLAISPDGNILVATLKGAQMISMMDLSSGMEQTRISTSMPVPHGIAITPDNKFVFVTSEGIGSEPGSIDAIHIESKTAVASIAAGQQTGGIAFWKIRQ